MRNITLFCKTNNSLFVNYRPGTCSNSSFNDECVMGAGTQVGSKTKSQSVVKAITQLSLLRSSPFCVHICKNHGAYIEALLFFIFIFNFSCYLKKIWMENLPQNIVLFLTLLFIKKHCVYKKITVFTLLNLTLIWQIEKLMIVTQEPPCFYRFWSTAFFLRSFYAKSPIESML